MGTKAKSQGVSVARSSYTIECKMLALNGASSRGAVPYNVSKLFKCGADVRYARQVENFPFDGSKIS
jgi:hypothetical protein